MLSVAFPTRQGDCISIAMGVVALPPHYSKREITLCIVPRLLPESIACRYGLTYPFEFVSFFSIFKDDALSSLLTLETPRSSS